MIEDDKLAHVQTPNFAQVQAYQEERPRDSCVSERESAGLSITQKRSIVKPTNTKRFSNHSMAFSLQIATLVRNEIEQKKSKWNLIKQLFSIAIFVLSRAHYAKRHKPPTRGK